MLTVDVVDINSFLTKAELERLGRFIVARCRCTRTDLSWLQFILLLDGGPELYPGYWELQSPFGPSPPRSEPIRSIIVLNTFWFQMENRIEFMERTLAHEYGHNWCQGHLLARLLRFPDENPPRIYYLMRDLDASWTHSREWGYRPEEVLAEDYRYFFSPYKEYHRMEKTAGLPTEEVRDFLWSLGRARYLGA